MATILLIDDDVCFRGLVATVLANRGHRLVDAGRCDAGERRIREEGPDVLILDGLLPDGDGAAWLKQQRAQGMKLPVLFVSAFRKTVREQKRIREECGAEDFLAKPATAPALLAKIERVLQKFVPAAPAEAILRPEDLLALEEMQRGYAVELPAHVKEMQAALEQLRTNPGDPGLQGVARRRAHQIAGTAGSFGFADVGDACAAIEETIAGLQAGADSSNVEIALAIVRASRACHPEWDTQLRATG